MPGSDMMQAAYFRFRLRPANRRCRLARAAFLLLSACWAGALAWPQEEPPQNPAPDSSSQDQPPSEEPRNAALDAPAPLPSNGARAVVHGVVKNAATGEPLARALVRIEGD